VSYGDLGNERAGVVFGDKILDLRRAWQALEKGQMPSNMIQVLEGPWRERAQHVLDNAEALVGKENISFDISDVRLGAPVPRPSKVVCLGLNYRDHADESGQPYPEAPILFSKASSCIIGPRDEVLLPPESDQIDWEVELAVVMGKRGRRIPEAEALDYVAGYTVLNDVSARDIQMSGKQWHRGKSFDTFGPMGPWIVTLDEIDDPLSLEVRCTISGVERQHSNTSYHISNVPQTIAFISLGMTLFPGDVIATGTPGGVGFVMTPPVYLKPGDDVVTEVEGIGQLRNRISSEKGV
jgi:acylpyruvate hydrolase